jgi:copper chaperone NosL
MSKLKFIILFFLFSCVNDKPQKIELNKDVCDYCKMVISDLKFASEIITKKGKVYKFDDYKCLRAFYKEHKDKIRKVYLVPCENDRILIPSEKAFILKSENIKGPMGGEYIAFEDENKAFEMRKLLGGKIMKFEEFINER